MRKIVIDPRVIKHLGRDLITSPEVAVIELLKNSIDAKAKNINYLDTYVCIMVYLPTNFFRHMLETLFLSNIITHQC